MKSFWKNIKRIKPKKANKQKIVILFVLLVLGVIFCIFTLSIANFQQTIWKKNIHFNTSAVIEQNTKETKTPPEDTLFYDRLVFKLKFLKDHDSLLVAKTADTEYPHEYVPKEIGIYQKSTKEYRLLSKTNYERLEYSLSPNKIFLLIGEAIQDPNSEINYKLVQSMKVINISTGREINIPFPKNQMLAGVLWKLEENKIYITARKPEGLDYSFKWYYEFNLNSSDFRLIATSNDFVLDYGDNKKDFGHFILAFLGFDGTGKDIIGIGEAQGDPRLLTVWRVNPETREFKKLYDYNTDTKYDWLISYGHPVNHRFQNNQLNIRSSTHYYSMNLTNGKITDLKLEYENKEEDKLDLESNLYEFVSYDRGNEIYKLKNKNTGEEIDFPSLKYSDYIGYKIITTLD